MEGSKSLPRGPTNEIYAEKNGGKSARGGKLATLHIWVVVDLFTKNKFAAKNFFQPFFNSKLSDDIYQFPLSF